MFRDDLKEFLMETFPDAKPASGGKELVMRCRFCGDSHDMKSKHFYIKLPNPGELSVFNCFKCGESGILSSKKLRIMSAYDTGMAIELDQYNKEAMKLPNNRIYRNTGVMRLYNTFISESAISTAKLNYINKRLGATLTYQDLIENKICLNLGDLLNSNHITQLTRYESVVRDLDESFLGFVSMDNSFVIMRNLRQGKVAPSIDTRYVNYNIFGKVDNSKRYYVLPNNINLNNPAPIKIHIAEGGFDILSVFYNLRGMNKAHNIYSAIGGKAYLNILKMFIQDMGLINVEFHIYIDNDIEDWTLRNIYNYMRAFDLNIYIHRNMYPGEKDFGIPLDRIVEQVTLLGGNL